MKEPEKSYEELLDEIRRMEQRLGELRRSDPEERYRRIIDTAEEGIWVLDEAYLTTFVNRRMAAMLLYEPEEMIGRRHDEFLFEEDFPDLSEKTAMRRQGIPGRYERRLKRKDGTVLWAHASASPILDGEGRFQGSFAMFTDITERKDAEKALRESEEKYRGIFENAVEGVFQSTPEGRLMTVNPAMARMFGYVTPTQMKEGITSIGSELYARAKDRRTFKKILEASGVVRGFEAQFHRKDGSLMWGSLNVRAVKARAEGEVLYYEGTLEDITARKGAEEALKESESRFKTLFNTAVDAIYLFEITPSGMPGRFVEVNEIGCERLGYTREEMLSMGPRDIDAREGAVDLPGIMESLIETGSVWFETTHVTREGDRIPVEISSRLFTQKDRTLVLSIARDISRRKQAEEGLRRSEERYRNIFENAVEGIYQVTPEGSYLSVNPALARIHGFDSPEEMIASVTDIAHQLYVDPSRRARLKQLVEEEGSVRNFEIMMRRKDGSLHWVSNTAHAVRDDTGRLAYYEGTVEDNTTQKKAKKKLKEQKSTLGGMLYMVSRITEARDPGKKKHQERVSRLARAIATEMGFSAEMADNIKKAALI